MKISAIKTYNFHTLNNTVNKTVQNPCENTGMKDLYPVSYSNYISFSAGITNKQKLKNIGEDNFPNEQILNRYKQAIINREDIRLYQIHQEYYSDLMKCETLDEAKEKYPEFNDVIDAKDVLYIKKRTFPKVVSEGKVEGLAVEDLSLELLKRHYGQLKGLSVVTAYWNRCQETLVNAFALLNIPIINKKYLLKVSKESPDCFFQSERFKKNIGKLSAKRWETEGYRENIVSKQKQKWQNPQRKQEQSEFMSKKWEDDNFRQMMSEASSQRMIENWQNPEFRELREEGLALYWSDSKNIEQAAQKMSERWNDESFRKNVTQLAKIRMLEKWQDPEYAKFISSVNSAKWDNPEYREKMISALKEKWNDPEYRKRMQVYSDALKLAWEMHPEISQKMAEIADEFPPLWKIIQKAKKGEVLSPEERSLEQEYFKKCHAQIPNFTKTVFETREKILAEWREQGVIPNED